MQAEPLRDEVVLMHEVEVCHSLELPQFEHEVQLPHSLVFVHVVQEWVSHSERGYSQAGP